MGLNCVSAAEPAGEEGAVPFSSGVYDDYSLSYLSDTQVLYLRGFLEKIPRGMHYFLFSDRVLDSSLNLYGYRFFVFVSKDVDVEVRNMWIPSKVQRIVFPSAFFIYRIELFEYHNSVVTPSPLDRWGLTEIWNYESGYITVYGPSQPFAWYFTGVPFASEPYNPTNLTFMFSCFSDLSYFPDLRQGREEVTYLHAQTVILASFVLFAVFRRLWLSIRGRVD